MGRIYQCLCHRIICAPLSVSYHVEYLGRQFTYRPFELHVTDARHPAALVLLIDPFLYPQDLVVPLVYLPVAGEPEVAVDPVGYPGSSRGLVDGDADRPVEQFFCVEYIVDLLVLQESVGMDACLGDIEVLPDERGPRGYLVSKSFS